VLEYISEERGGERSGGPRVCSFTVTTPKKKNLDAVYPIRSKPRKNSINVKREKRGRLRAERRWIKSRDQRGKEKGKDPYR